MPSLAEFVRSHVQGLTRRRAAMPRPAQCMIVKRVAPGSVAAHAGIAPKDFLAQMDGAAASTLVPELYLYHAPRHEYVFYARSSHEAIDLHATGIDIGVEVAYTPEAIRASYDPRNPNYKSLEALWEARDHATLETLCSETLARGPRDSPALLFRGAALYEAARHDEALKLLREYHDEYASHWTMNFTAVALYYLGLDALQNGQRDQALGLLYTAFDHNDFDRIAAALEKQTGERPAPPPPRWVGQRFPVDYHLPALDTAQPVTVKLSDRLAAMPEEKRLIVCVLDGYRGNGPYNAFMARYLGWAAHFAPYLYGLDAITEIRDRPAKRDHYFRYEDQVRAARLPFALLLDASGAVAAAIEPHGSPHILVLDRQGIVRYEGEMESADLWALLSSTAG
jgi:tetratricopeptide (TPR) repeat protein